MANPAGYPYTAGDVLDAVDVNQIVETKRDFGDGSDGSLTISSGTTTLTRDMFYTDLLIDGTGILDTNG